MLARALDRLFEADRASLLTRVVLAAVKAYAVDLSQIHQDTTSVKLMGAYQNQHRRGVQLLRGYSKDHRPDLRQLVYDLSVTHDGAIPVLFKAHDGNRTDDTLHWENWQMLRGLLGRSDFLYVADSKLCVSETLRNIDRNQGRFITVVPRTRGEVKSSGRRWRPPWFAGRKCWPSDRAGSGSGSISTKRPAAFTRCGKGSACIGIAPARKLVAIGMSGGEDRHGDGSAARTGRPGT